MRHSFTLDTLVLGSILGNPPRLATVEMNDIGDTEIAGVVAALQQGQTESLTIWLKAHGVEWQYIDDGQPAIQAIQTKAKRMAKLLQAKRAANQAKLLLWSDAEELQRKLRDIADSLS